MVTMAPGHAKTCYTRTNNQLDPAAAVRLNWPAMTTNNADVLTSSHAHAMRHGVTFSKLVQVHARAYWCKQPRLWILG